MSRIRRADRRAGEPPSPLLCLLVLAASAAASGQDTRGRALGKNGGFEQGLKGWKVSSQHRLVEDPGQAHTGTRCLLGEVRRRRTAQVARRTYELQADRMYRLSVWARADRRSKLTIWRRTSGSRHVVASWHKVGRKWRRYRASFTVEADGPTVIGIAAPSSHDAPPGRMWIDDVSLKEFRLLPEVRVSEGLGFSDEPRIVPSGRRHAWVAWLSFRDGHDTLQAARIRLGSPRIEVEARWEVAGGPGLAVLHPELVAGPDQDAWLLYSAEIADNWDVHAVRLTAKGPALPIRITAHPGVDAHPAGTVRGGRLWVAWESNRNGGRHQVFSSTLRNGRPDPPRPLSSAEHNSYAPALSRAGSGRLRAVWHSPRSGNVDLYTRAGDGATWSPERRLTRAPGIDREVVLARSGEDLWLAWEHASHEGYGVGRSKRRVQVARLRGDRLEMPKGLRQTRLWKQAEAPSIDVDDQGRLWVTARVPRDRHSGWDVLLWGYAGSRWTPPWHLSVHKGLRRRPGLIVEGERLVSVFQGDDLPGRWTSYADSAQGASDVFLSTVRPKTRLPPGARLAPFQEPPLPYPPARHRKRLEEDRPAARIEHGDRSYALLFGDLHEHSDISVCHRTRDETQDQTYQMMRDLLALDFGVITDHGNNLNAYLWSHQQKSARANHDPERFVTFLGQEWTSGLEETSRRHPFGYYGHRNLILGDPRFPRWFVAAEGGRPDELWATLARTGTDFLLIPHQLADLGNVPVDWSFHHERHQPVAEIYQQRGSYECLGCPRQARNTAPRGYFLQDAWARGLVLGVVAAPDHAGGAGKTAVYAAENSRAAILEALHARRTYGTTGARIHLDVRVNGHLMGEVGAPSPAAAVRVEVRVDGAGPLAAVEILRRNEVVFRGETSEPRCELAYVDPPQPVGTHYYVRVTQRDGEMAWSSPVWLGRPPRQE